ncbi:MAG: anaerobic ribonucleoside-triphosphate reductase activating protein [Actinobacteria bacterium]|nr:anaerobic ribonucleoside-triphosphate reductase activating protein [Actinomycetota bacterium]
MKVELKFKVKGFIPVTMLDWDGKIASTLFLGGCNYRCPFCQNKELVLSPEELPDVPWEAIREYLMNKKNWIDGVVITGGEPCINNGLFELMEEIKKLDCSIKIDTNGSRSDVLQRALDSKLVDYIAMDIKTSFGKYAEATGVLVDISEVKKSIDLIMNSKIDYEFRTTLVPSFVLEEDILEIANYIKNTRLYVLQQFNPENVLDPALAKVKPYSREKALKMAEKCREIIPVKVRGVG